MSGSGARDGLGSPPWEPADPVPSLDDTQALPGLGSVPVPGKAPGYGGGQPWSPGDIWPEQQPGPGGQGSRRPRDAFDATRWDTPVAGDGAGNGPGGTGGGGDTAGGGNRSRALSNGATTAAHGWQRDGVPGAKPPKPKRKRSFLRELPVLIVVALVLAVLIKTFVVQAFYIPSASMENTLEIGDRVLINKVVYHTRSINRGDIVVFDGTGSWDFNTPPASSNVFSKLLADVEGVVGISHDSSIYIKRVIGLPGDHVACCNSKGQVTVNGVPLSESSYLYPGNAPSTQSFNVTVPRGSLWMMGDHRAVSYDSRGHMGDPGGGSIPESAVLGRAFVIIWPPSRWGILNIPATFQQPALNAPPAGGGGFPPRRGGARGRRCSPRWITARPSGRSAPPCRLPSGS